MAWRRMAAWSFPPRTDAVVNGYGDDCGHCQHCLVCMHLSWQCGDAAFLLQPGKWRSA